MQPSLTSKIQRIVYCEKLNFYLLLIPTTCFIVTILLTLYSAVANSGCINKATSQTQTLASVSVINLVVSYFCAIGFHIVDHARQKQKSLISPWIKAWFLWSVYYSLYTLQFTSFSPSAFFFYADPILSILNSFLLMFVALNIKYTSTDSKHKPLLTITAIILAITVLLFLKPSIGKLKLISIPDSLFSVGVIWYFMVIMTYRMSDNIKTIFPERSKYFSVITGLMILTMAIYAVINLFVPVWPYYPWAAVASLAIASAGKIILAATFVILLVTIRYIYRFRMSTQFIDNNTSLFLGVSASGIIVVANQVFRREFHISKHEITDGNISIYDMIDLPSARVDSLLKRIKTHDKIEGRYINLVHNIGNEEGSLSFHVPVSMTGVYLAPVDDRSPQYLLFGLSITDAESEKLEHLGMLMGNLTHETRRIIPKLSDYIESTKIHIPATDHLLLPRAYEAMRVLSHTAERYNVLKTNKDIFATPEMVNIVDIFKQREPQIIGEFPQIKFQYHVETNGDTRIQAKRIAIEILIDNILSNAVDSIVISRIHIGIITVSINRVDRFTQVRIHNTGPNLSNKKLKSFYQLFGSTKQKGKGLGNYISYRIVALHGGLMKVENTSSPSGVRVTFSIPSGDIK